MTMPSRPLGWGLLGVMAVLAFTSSAAVAAVAAGTAVSVLSTADGSWWLWPLGLFVVCFLLGIVAVPAGVGGGVLFVPIVGGFFPFHLDFVRGAGLLVALASALAAGPDLLRGGLASLRLALPLALLASVSSVVGALCGLSVPAATVNILLGATVLGIVLLMWMGKKDDVPHRHDQDAFWRPLNIAGLYHDFARGKDVAWRASNIGLGIVLFAGIGFLGGFFGVGAGWANVPALNLVMGIPIKVAAATSGLILALSSSSATWSYLSAGAIMPIIAVPAVVGMMLGARIGVRLLTVLGASRIRQMVMGLLLFAGLRALFKGLGVWV